MTLQITVNGDAMDWPGGTLADLLAQLQLTGRRVAVEVNRDIIPKSEHSQYCLRDGDVIEIVHAIGGG